MNDEKMTQRQSWAIFCLTRIDVRGTSLTKAQAGRVIDDLKRGGEAREQAANDLSQMQGAATKGKLPPEKQDWEGIYSEAYGAGMAAGRAATPRAMVVAEHQNPLNDNSPIKRAWVENEGACGFASVIIRPGTCSFARWLVKNDLGGKDYYGGVAYGVSAFGQSIERKEAFAVAFQKVLESHGISSTVRSNLD